MFVQLIKLLRPHQWVKNVFVFAPIVFGGHLLEWSDWQKALLVFLSFCLACSAIYCLNDVRDAETDRQHPIKCHRPIASGAVSPRMGIMAMIGCIAFAVLPLYGLPLRTLVIVMAYIILNLAYCFVLKRMAIVDVMTIATGYVLRILAGGWTTGIWVSQWIVLMTFLLTLFLALAKRRDDAIIYERTGERMRSSIEKYNIPFINASLAVTASITMVCYIMYSVSAEVTARIGSPYVYVTSLFVLLALLRYLQIALVFENSGNPTRAVMRDGLIHVAVACWVISFMCLLYL